MEHLGSGDIAARMFEDEEVGGYYLYCLKNIVYGHPQWIAVFFAVCFYNVIGTRYAVCVVAVYMYEVEIFF